MQPAIKKILVETANIVAEKAKTVVPVKTGKAQRSIKGIARGYNAAVQGGLPKRVPYYGWLDFGGNRDHTGTRSRPLNKKGKPRRATAAEKRELNKGRQERRFYKFGRYLYPSIFQTLPKAKKHLEDAIVKLITEGLPHK